MIRKIAKRLFRMRMLPNAERVRQFLGPEALVLVDVGATGGPAGVWDEASSLTHFVFFDPDPRARIKVSQKSTAVYPTGLWSNKTQKVLHLAANPDASSLFEFNKEVLDDFLNAPMHEVVGKELISLDAMENVIPAKRPDFIKVDAEGADLEILKGAKRFLEESCLGVFIEVAMAERHKCAPLFGEIDSHMRGHNFMLMHLYPEHWIRSNNVFGLFSSVSERVNAATTERLKTGHFR